MRTLVSFAFTVLLLASGSVSSATEGDYQTEYFVAVGDYFDVAYETVLDVSDAGIIDDELPCIFFVADWAKVSPMEVAEVRAEGTSWHDVNRTFNLSAANFYVMMAGKIDAKPYQEVFAKYKNTPSSDWNKLVLSDEDYVKLANLRLIYQHHDYNPYSIMKMVEYGKSFACINNQVRIARAEMIKQEMAAASNTNKNQKEQN